MDKTFFFEAQYMKAAMVCQDVYEQYEFNTGVAPLQLGLPTTQPLQDNLELLNWGRTKITYRNYVY